MPSPAFHQLANEFTTLLVYKPTRGVCTKEAGVETPLTKATGRELTSPDPIVIPILRAGLGVLESMTRLLPATEVGFLGVKRGEQTLVIEAYANHLPQDLSGRQYFLIDPMLTTGGTLVAAINYVLERGARDVTCTCLLTVPEDIAAVKDAVNNRAEVEVVVGRVDDRLNESAYIVSGLGGAGGRLYGPV